ncbi:MAG TPA: NAD(P)H-dependent oxidoreductase [Candidatus Saccharimonadales bacterium]|nr:NAD(P)H-dependent oxidoreductase [Candidatus Saccharimonadales bacterium]
MQKILVITGSTRPNRKSLAVAEWFLEAAKSHKDDFEFELIDLAEVNLPFLDEPMPPMMGQYHQEHTKKWAEVIGPADGYVFISPEYNHSYSPVLKNAIDFLYAEWRHKPVGFVSYGVAEGVRGVEHLKTVMIQVDTVPMNAQVSFSLFNNFTEEGKVKADEHHHKQLQTLLDELKWWGETLKVGRANRKSY